MDQANIQQSLDKFLQSLISLCKLTLPTESRGALHTTHHRLNALSTALQGNGAHDKGRLEALFRVSKSLDASCNLEEVLTNVMDSVNDLTGAECGFIGLFESGDRQYTMAAARNFKKKPLQQKGVQVSRTLIDTVVSRGEGSNFCFPLPVLNGRVKH
jgi:transcriptional regulator with GAF, ATPase, and Fis domain